MTKLMRSNLSYSEVRENNKITPKNMSLQAIHCPHNKQAN